MSTTKPDSDAQWYLEGFDGNHRVMRRVPLRPLPFIVGRRPGLPLTLDYSNISRKHAQFELHSGHLMLRDLESRNGTYLNRVRINELMLVQNGDIVHFGSTEFRVALDEPTDPADHSVTMEFQGVLPDHFLVGTREFLEMLRLEAVAPRFQPIISFKTGRCFGYEVLGRGGMEGVPETPGELFRLAAACRMEAELSRLFRKKGVEIGLNLPGKYEFFVNLHPVEMQEMSSLLSLLQDLNSLMGRHTLTLEVHESLVSRPDDMAWMHRELSQSGMKLAYDDFGAGQARLIELAEVPPHYLKFDRSMIENLHKAPPQRRQMVEMLVRYARDLGVEVLAEGVEHEAEATICREMGFTCAQGFYFGKPLTGDQLMTQTL